VLIETDSLPASFPVRTDAHRMYLMTISVLLLVVLLRNYIQTTATKLTVTVKIN